MSKFEFARRVEALAQFRVADVTSPWLSDTDAHHLFRVLRAREDEEIVVTDGAGSWAFARVGVGSIERVSDLVTDEPDPEATLYLAPLKGDRSDWVVTRATELGVTRVVPLLSERVVVRWRDGAGAKVIARWRRLALESGGQCRRTYDLLVDDPTDVASVPAPVAVADFEGRGSLDGVRSIAIGPEGGWAEREWDSARTRIGLGETVLRSETAALAAATLLVGARSGWSRHDDGRPVA